jgi:phosphatidylinositol glycan class B
VAQAKKDPSGHSLNRLEAHAYAHPLSESAAGAALVTGLCLLYPGRGLPSERRIFIGAVMMGFAAVLRPQLVPAIAVGIVIAIGGIRRREHYPALLGGLSLPIVLSGLLDWITWGWPFHSIILYVYYNSVGGVASFFGRNPVYSYLGWEWVSWGFMECRPSFRRHRIAGGQKEEGNGYLSSWR